MRLSSYIINILPDNYREYTWKNFACTQVGRKVISIKDIITDQSDQLDYPDRVIQMTLGYNHLVIATVKQCFIHKLTSWNTPVTFDLKEGTISMILLAERSVTHNNLCLLAAPYGFTRTYFG